MPIVPKRIGEISIEVSVILAGDVGGAMMNQAGDSVRRKLYVVVGIPFIFSIYNIIIIFSQEYWGGTFKNMIRMLLTHG